MNHSKREARIRRVLAITTFITVPSEKGGYLKLCANYRKTSGKKRRIGTFARVTLGTALSQRDMEALVRESIQRGTVLKIEESGTVLLARALAGTVKHGPKNPLCDDRCQLREHKGYATCRHTGRCEYANS